MADLERLEREKKYLQNVKDLIKKEIERLDVEIKEIPNRFKKRYSDTSGGDEDLIESLINQAIHKKEQLQRMLDNCYFGQFVFTDDELQKRETFYLGKTSVINDGQMYVIDWRAPISTLYYEQDLGHVEYESNEGMRSGLMDLKSQIRIKKGELEEVIDTDLMTKDELILPFLKAAATDKMKDIVASIQKEQNEIIRAPINKTLIVQGVAGSGKTSVALHRIAYLLYQYNKYTADQFLVIGPNKCFNNYTSMVLPDLDSEGINQITFSELLEKCKLKVKVIEDNESKGVCNYKSSLAYKDSLNKFISGLFNTVHTSISLYDTELISETLIDKYLDTAIGSFKERINVTMDKCISYIKSRQEELLDEISKNLKEEKKKHPEKDIQIFTITQEAKKQLQKGCRDLVKKEFSKFNYKTLDLYKMFIENFEVFEKKLSQEEIVKIKQMTLTNLSNKVVATSDIPALLYLSIITNEKSTNHNYVHIVIDEAQDYGLFHYYVLRLMFNNATFSIFGDLGQSIYAYKSISSWDDVNKYIFNNNADVAYLNESYRTTKEITLEANKILGRLSLPVAEPVLRTGKPVAYINDSNIEKEIADMLENNYSSIALICKTDEEARTMFKQLHKKFEKIKLVKGNDNTYSGGLCVVDVNSSKGLEFDSVIINDASEQVYASTNTTDLKKLYVAMTRALHELKICYSNDLTNSLTNSNAKGLTLKED